MPRSITIVGGGIAGLVAAIECAERGTSVHLHEANARLGGRARSLGPPYLANYGPHALYTDGPFYPWLRERSLSPSLGRPSLFGYRTRIDGRLTMLPRALLVAPARLRGAAPADIDYRTWARGRAGERAAEAAIGYVSLPTFHHDPGELSAAFCQERFRRLLRPTRTVRYVRGGWSVLVDAMVGRARELGVRIETRSRVTELPEPPVILALPLAAAPALLPGTALGGLGARTVLLDVALAGLHRPLRAVLDLNERVYVLRVTGADATAAPSGEDLIQASAGLRPGESIEEATSRIETVIDAAFTDWRSRETWRRRSLAEGASGALDPPGATWRERPAVDQGDGIFLAGDQVAAPGLLSEVSFNSALYAAQSVARRHGTIGAQTRPTLGSGRAYQDVQDRPSAQR
jgi:hypothetical protein